MFYSFVGSELFLAKQNIAKNWLLNEIRPTAPSTQQMNKSKFLNQLMISLYKLIMQENETDCNTCSP